MKPNMVKLIAAVLFMISFVLIPSPLRVHAQEAQSLSSSAVEYELTSSLQAEVKSLLNERTFEGTRIAAVIRLRNESSQSAVVPEYELRVRTEEGIEYTLIPSPANIRTIQPKDQEELNYMLVLKRKDAFFIHELNWVSVNEYVYPLVETKVLSIPVSSLEWKGDASIFSEQDQVKAWGEPFTVPVLSESLQYKIIQMDDQNTPEGAVRIVTLLVHNTGDTKEWIPDFLINGKSRYNTSMGKRVEQGRLVLAPGEQRFIHYTIPVEEKDVWSQLIVLTPESYIDGNQTAIPYTVGRLSIPMPLNMEDSKEKPSFYQLKDTIQFGIHNKLIQSGLEVSIVDLNIVDEDGNGYKTVVSKFKVLNRGSRPVPLPDFGTEMTSASGYTYTGIRQKTDLKTLVPNLSYVISYSYRVPTKEAGTGMVIHILDGQSTAPYQVPIASLRTNVQPQSALVMSIYPFQVDVKNTSLDKNFSFSGSKSTYALKINLNLNVQYEENVVIDKNFSNMRVELVNANGRILGSEALSFNGPERLTSGERTIRIEDVESEYVSYPMTIQFYETLETSDGELKRLLKSIKKEQ